MNSGLGAIMNLYIYFKATKYIIKMEVLNMKEIGFKINLKEMGKQFMKIAIIILDNLRIVYAMKKE